MATLTLKDKEKNRLLKKFHTLLGRVGAGSEGKEAILWSYQVDSSSDLSEAQLIEICNMLDMQLNPALAKMDKLRKQAMASIGGWLRVAGRESNANIIKAIACRSTGYDNFNLIPAERLRNLYYNFRNKQNDKASVDAIAAGAMLTIGAELMTDNYFLN